MLKSFYIPLALFTYRCTDEAHSEGLILDKVVYKIELLTSK